MLGTALISVVGVLAVELPLCVTLKAMIETMAASVGGDDVSTLTLNATNATAEGLTWRPSSNIHPSRWGEEGNEQYYENLEDDPVGLLLPYWTLKSLVGACPWFMSQW